MASNVAKEVKIIVRIAKRAVNTIIAGNKMAEQLCIILYLRISIKNHCCSIVYYKVYPILLILI